jgi:H+-transporting ATPase
MRLVLGIATVLGIIGPIASLGLFYLGSQVFHLDHRQLQPMMYLMLSVAGHLTIFLARTRGPFWSIRPAPVLWIACLGTQIVATCIAVFGILMPPLDWRWAAAVWGYALIWALVSDRAKLLAYRIFDSPKATAAAKVQAIAAIGKEEAKPDSKGAPATAAEAKPDAKAAPVSQTKVETEPDVKAKSALHAPAGTDPGLKAAAASDAKTEAKSDGKAVAATEGKGDAKSDAKAVPARKPRQI